MPDGLLWLGLGFLAAWILVVGYVVRLWLTQRELHQRIEDLERRQPPTGGVG